MLWTHCSVLIDQVFKSMLNMLLVLGIIFHIFLDIPAGKVGFQVFFHHKIHGCLERNLVIYLKMGMHRQTCYKRVMSHHNTGKRDKRMNISWLQLWNIAIIGGWGATPLLHRIILYLHQVLGDASPSVSFWNLCVLQVHRFYPNKLVQQNSSILWACRQRKQV